MAGPITHLLLAKQFVKHHDTDAAAFIAGSLLPDIRYLGVVERTSSHPPTTTLDDVTREPNPQWAGVRFHVYTDHVTEQLRAAGYDCPALNGNAYGSIALKIAEDRQALSQYPSIASDGRDITTPAANPFSIAPDDIADWYRLLRDLFTDFSDLALRNYLIALHFEPDIAEHLIGLSRDTEVVRTVHGYFPDFLKIHQ